MTEEQVPPARMSSRERSRQAEKDDPVEPTFPASLEDQPALRTPPDADLSPR